MRRWRGVAAAMAVSVALSGCVKQNNQYTIYPDGSGKVVMEAVLSGQVAMLLQGLLGGGMGGEGGEGEGGPSIEEALKDGFKIEGIAAWKDLKVEKIEDGAKLKVSGTGYFDDINNVRSQQDSGLVFKRRGSGDGKGTTTKGESGYELTVTSSVGGGGMGGMPGGPGGPGGQKMSPEQRDMARAMARAMLAGFESKTTFTLPGAVSEATPVASIDGRKIKVVMTADDVMKLMDSGKLDRQARAVCGAETPEVTAEWEAFKKEMAAAKEQAAKEKAEREKREAEKAEKEKKKEGEKKGEEKKPGEPGKKKPEEF